MPVTERAPAAWFAAPQLQAPEIAAFALAAPPEIAAAWTASDRRFQQAVACVQQLWQCDADGVHADISRREVLAMRHVSEHLLHLMRSQHTALHRAAVVSQQLQRLRGALAAVWDLSLIHI